MAGFELSAGVNVDNVFLASYSELAERFDPEMVSYNKKVKQFTYATKPLKSLLLTSPQYGANESGITRNSIQSARYIRITDITENGNLIDGLGVTAETVEKKYTLKNNDLLFARSGNTVGKTYLHKSDTVSYSCFFAGYMIRFVVDSEKILPDYLFLYTQITPYKDWVKAVQRTAGQPNINAEEYKSLLIPLPELATQKSWIAKYQMAVQAKQQKEQEAQALLDSIDGYLLNALGITLPQQDNCLESRIFIIPFSEVIGGRLDSQFYKIEFQALVDNIASNKHFKLKEIAEFSTETWNQSDYFDENFPYIEISEIELSTGEIANVKQVAIDEAPSRAKMIVRQGDIIISTTRPTRGAIAHNQLEGINIASTGFAVIRRLKNDIVSKEFLFYLLKMSSTLRQMEQRATGGNYPAITQEELGNIIIPYVEKLQQTEIAAHISQIRAQAKQLQHEAAEVLATAKTEIERMILGEV